MKKILIFYLMLTFILPFSIKNFELKNNINYLAGDEDLKPPNTEEPGETHKYITRA
jgi:hypothetical protein